MMKSGKAFVAMDRLLDTNRDSPRWLQRPDLVQIGMDAILKGTEDAYDLHSWVVMPNHVHMLITPRMDVSRILQRPKGSTAFHANKLLALTGPFWQDESYDRLVRNAEEFKKIQAYIEQNPVRAGLTISAEDYAWSSEGGLKPAAG
jgi:putative DNA methylase